MKFEKLTRKSHEALAAAKELAEQNDQQVMEPEHLLAALLSDPEGVVFPVVQRLGISPRTLRDRVEELIAKLPKAYGGSDEASASHAFLKVLDQAESEAEALK